MHSARGALGPVWFWKVHRIWLGLWEWEEMNRDIGESLPKKKGRTFQEKSKDRHESISPTLYRSTWKRAGGGGTFRKIGWGYGCNIEKLDVIKCNGVCDRIWLGELYDQSVLHQPLPTLWDNMKEKVEACCTQGIRRGLEEIRSCCSVP